jgi:hypothetical protein
MNITKLGPVSMRGRMAFALMCLEQGILRLSGQPAAWVPLL